MFDVPLNIISSLIATAVGIVALYSFTRDKHKLATDEGRKMQEIDQIKGNTSTCVEKTGFVPHIAHLSWKHLHVRGENTGTKNWTNICQETPPRAWRKLFLLTRPHLWSIMMSMKKQRKYEYTGVNIPRDVKKLVRAVAAEKETSISQAALELLELGLAEYVRKNEQENLIRANKTQIDMTAIDEMLANRGQA